MRITIQKSELKNAVSGFTAVTKGARAKKHLPILTHIRFDAGNGTITGTATNLAETLVFTFDGVPERDGAGLVSLAELKSAVRGPGRDTLTVDMTDDTVTLVNRVAGCELTSTVDSPLIDEWPPTPARILTQPAPGWPSAFRRLAPFASVDKARYILNSVFIEQSKAGFSMVATDGRRLSRCPCGALPLPHSIIVPTTPALTGSTFNGADCEIGAGTDSEGRPLFAVTCGPWHYVVLAVVGYYPNYRQVIPDDKNSVTCRISFEPCDIAQLQSLIGAMPGGDEGAIGLKGDLDGRVTLTVDTTSAVVPGASCRGVAFCGCFNRWYLAEALHAGFVTWEWIDGFSPLKSLTTEGAVHVLMPRCR